MCMHWTELFIVSQLASPKCIQQRERDRERENLLENLELSGDCGWTHRTTSPSSSCWRPLLCSGTCGSWTASSSRTDPRRQKEWTFVILRSALPMSCCDVPMTTYEGCSDYFIVRLDFETWVWVTWSKQLVICRNEMYFFIKKIHCQ